MAEDINNNLDKTPKQVSGLIRVRSAKEVAEDVTMAEEITNMVALDGLAVHIKKVWNVCRDAKSDVTKILNECKLQRNGEYSQEVLQKIRAQGGSTSYNNITNQKCLAGESWIADMAPPDERPWAIEPTPIPEVNEDVMDAISEEVANIAMERTQQGEEWSLSDSEEMGHKLRVEYEKQIREQTESAAKKMTKIMEDQLVHGGFQETFDDFRYDLITYPAGIIKFEMKQEVKTVYKEDEEGNWIVGTEPVIRESWRRVSPFAFFPSPNIKDVNEGDICEKTTYTRKTLLSLIGQPDYKEEAIKNVLEQYGRGGLVDWIDTNEIYTREELQDIHSMTDMSAAPIDAIEFHGSVQGSLLKEWGMDGIDDELGEYDIWAILIKDQVIKAELNPHPLGHKPYYVSSYERNPDSLWGRGIPQKVKDSQNGANIARRALLDNVALSSGPQVMINSQYLPPNEDVTAMYPRKIWFTRKGSNLENVRVSDVFGFFQPESNANELLTLQQVFANEADEDSGIPKVAEGSLNNTANNAASTASGLNMVLDNASKNIKQVILNVDKFVIKRLVEDLYNLNMLDPNIPNEAKGDLEIVARGALSVSIRNKLNNLRRDFMLMVLSNEQLVNILGQRGIANLLREVAKPLDMPIESIVPSEETLEERQKLNQQGASIAMMQTIMNVAIEKGYIDQEQANEVFDEAMSEIEKRPQNPQEAQQ